jgi:hypothetical protein
MCPTVISRSTGVLLSLLLVMLVMQSPGATATGHRPPASPPQRLRLKVHEKTLPVGVKTTFTVEFLDRSYGQVPNDQTRSIKLWQAPVPGESGAGNIEPGEVVVNPGEWSSAEIAFVSTQPGRLLLKASADALEDAKTLVTVTRQKASAVSRLSELLEPVVSAAPDHRIEFMFLNNNAPANGKSPVKLNLLPPSDQHEELRVNLRVTGAYVEYQGERRFGFAEITIPEGEGASDEISLTSNNPGEIEIRALVEPGGLKQQAKALFERPRPKSIYLDDISPTISSYQREVPFTIKLADQDKVPATSDREQLISLSSPDNSDIVEFDNQGNLNLPANVESITSTLRLKQPPATAEISLLAKDKTGGLSSDLKTVQLESPVHKLVLSGPLEVTRGGHQAEMTVTLTDAKGTPQPADWERRIYLTADAGRLDPSEVVIQRGQERATVKYFSPEEVGKYNLRAESHGIAPATLQMRIGTATYWLITLAILGGIVGGVVKHVRKNRLAQIRPRWTGECWDLGLSGHILGSTVSGLLLYLVFKLGLSQVIGTPILPAGLDVGTRTFAFFIAVIGGYAGIVVLKRLVSWCLPRQQEKKKADRAAAAATDVSSRPEPLID